jgi:hypothetical protein
VGTFHDDMGELHGRTVVVETTGPTVLVGQVHEERDGRLILLHADRHEGGPDAPTREEFVASAVRLGHWPRHGRVVVPSDEIASIRFLSEIEVAPH